MRRVICTDTVTYAELLAGTATTVLTVPSNYRAVRFRSRCLLWALCDTGDANVRSDVLDIGPVVHVGLGTTVPAADGYEGQAVGLCDGIARPLMGRGSGAFAVAFRLRGHSAVGFDLTGSEAQVSVEVEIEPTGT